MTVAAEPSTDCTWLRIDGVSNVDIDRGGRSVDEVQSDIDRFGTSAPIVLRGVDRDLELRRLARGRARTRRSAQKR